MNAGTRVYKLRCHPDPVATAPDTALQHVTDAQVSAYPFHVDRTFFVSEG